VSTDGDSLASVVIVGSGPAGVSAAWPLVEAGVPVLMIDAAPAPPPPAPPRGDIAAFRADPARWRHQFGADLAGLAAGSDVSPKLATPLARHALAGFAAATGLATENFSAFGSLARGGLSTIWGALAAVYDDRDLAGFPIGRADLLPSYAAVAARIGLSGGAVDGVTVADGPDLTEPARRVLHAYGRAGPDGLQVQRATNAVLMQARDGREGCAQCGLCLWGCARGSIYSSAPEIDRLRRLPHFRYRPGLTVTRLERDGEGHVLVAGAEAIRARRILLAAGTIATSGLVLRRLGVMQPVRLLANPVAAIAFVLPGLVARKLPGRSFALAQLRYALDLPDGERAAGALYGADALPLTAIAQRLPLSRPAALRLSRALAPALLLATIYLPGRFSRNTLRLTETGLAITGEQPPDTVKALRDAGRRLARGMRRLGAFVLPGSFSPSPPGADAHYAGTLPMGGPAPHGCSLDGEINACPGLHVVDGAALPVLPARHCTLTIMANADRIARLLAPRLRSGA
jgi:choline dehydrogenase-like flavoprotein